MEQLAVHAESHEVRPGADGQVLRELERVLIHRSGGAHRVGPSDQDAGVGADLDERERTVRPAGVQEPLVTDKELALSAAAQERTPDQARRLGRRSAPTGDRGGTRRVERPAHIHEIPALAVGVVVRQLEMAAGTELHRHLGEQVLRREVPL